MSAPPPPPDGRTVGLFALAVTLGSGNFLAVRLSNLGLPPFWGAGVRFGLAALAFVALCALLRVRPPARRDLPTMALYGVLGFGGFYALMYWALLSLTAGMATVVLALVPLATLLLAAAQGLERVRLQAVAGAVVATAGIAWMALEPGRVDVRAGPMLALIGAVACVSQSLILGKRLAGSHPAAVNAVGMAVGSGLLLGVSAIVGERWSLPSDAAAGWALAYLVTLGSVGLFLAGLTVVRRWTASATAYMFVLFPVVTMLLERVLLEEPFTATGVLGALLVMAGVWFGAFVRLGRPRVRPSSSR